MSCRGEGIESLRRLIFRSWVSPAKPVRIGSRLVGLVVYIVETSMWSKRRCRTMVLYCRLLNIVLAVWSTHISTYQVMHVEFTQTVLLEQVFAHVHMLYV